MCPKLRTAFLVLHYCLVTTPTFLGNSQSIFAWKLSLLAGRAPVAGAATGTATGGNRQIRFTPAFAILTGNLIRPINATTLRPPVPPTGVTTRPAVPPPAPAVTTRPTVATARPVTVPQQPLVYPGHYPGYPGYPLVGYPLQGAFPLGGLGVGQTVAGTGVGGAFPLGGLGVGQTVAGTGVGVGVPLGGIPGGQFPVGQAVAGTQFPHLGQMFFPRPLGILPQLFPPRRPLLAIGK